MPKKKAKLPDATIAAFAEWIKQGAPWPAERSAAAATAAAAPPADHRRAARVVVVPAAGASGAAGGRNNAEWAKTDIDRFVLARLEREGLQPVKPADRRTLIRRATLDLTGLPPTAEEVDAFVADTAPDAFAKVVDRLLASPRYGEAWGRHWLDVARYAEDDPRSLDPMQRGYNPYPNAYLYRDWVVKAFNDDMPYDQFVKAQLAADLLDEHAARAHAARARLPRPRPVVLRQRIGRGDARRRAPRSRRRRVARLPRADRRVRALPRPQVRPDSAARLLLAGRRVPEQPVPRVPAGARLGRRRVQGAREEKEEQGEAALRLHEHGEPSSSPRRSRSRRRSTCRRRGR